MTDFKSKVDDLRKQRLEDERRRIAQREAQQLEQERQRNNAIRQKEEENKALIAKIRASAAYQQAYTELNSKIVHDALKYMHKLMKPTVTSREVRKGLFSWFSSDYGEKVYVTRPVPLAITVSEAVTYEKLPPHEERQHEATGMPKTATGISVKITMPVGDYVLDKWLERIKVEHRKNIVVKYHINSELTCMIIVNGEQLRSSYDGDAGEYTWYEDVFLPFESVGDVLDYFVEVIGSNIPL